MACLKHWNYVSTPQLTPTVDHRNPQGPDKFAFYVYSRIVWPLLPIQLDFCRPGSLKRVSTRNPVTAIVMSYVYLSPACSQETTFRDRCCYKVAPIFGPNYFPSPDSCASSVILRSPEYAVSQLHLLVYILRWTLVQPTSSKSYTRPPSSARHPISILGHSHETHPI